MNSIIVVSLTGSLMTVFVLLLEKLLADKVSNVMLYRMSRIAVLFYLVPLRVVGIFYRSILREMIHFVEVNFRSPVKTTFSYDQNDWIVVQDAGRYYMSSGLRREQKIALLYFAVVLFFIIFKIIQDAKAQRKLRKAIAEVHCERDSVLQSMQSRMKISKSIKVCKVKKADQTAVLGLIRPILICSDEISDDSDKEYIYGHELWHIKRRDVLWSFLAYVCSVIHFWNPLAFLLYRQVNRLKELSCDEMVIQDMNEESRMQYAHLLEDLAESEQAKKEETEKPQQVKSIHHTILERRMETIMNYKNKSGKQRRKNNFLFFATVFCASLVSLGYQDVTSLDVRAQGTYDDENAAWECIVDYEEAEGIDFDILYDAQYVTEDGSIYELILESEEQAKAICWSHDYQNVTLSYHERNNSGGCTITVYSAKRCSKCGKVIDSVLLRTINNVTCTH